VTRRVGDGTNTSGFAGTVEMCFATGPLGLRRYSSIMRCVRTREKVKERERKRERDRERERERGREREREGA
jgi:hypothetical protein